LEGEEHVKEKEERRVENDEGDGEDAGKRGKLQGKHCETRRKSKIRGKL
jgi:hypothetical protein